MTDDTQPATVLTTDQKIALLHGLGLAAIAAVKVGVGPESAYQNLMARILMIQQEMRQ